MARLHPESTARPWSDHRRAGGCVAFAVIGGWLVGAVAHAEDGPACRIVETRVLPRTELPGRVTPLGGISDLATDAAVGTAPERYWVITDRGPNGSVMVGDVRRRTLVEPAFVPSIVALSWPTAAGDDRVRIDGILPLADRDGEPLTGRPNGIVRDEAILTADGVGTVPADPDGIDSEGLVRMSDGTFWIVEEYRPSILHVGADGRAIARYVPAGHVLEGAGMAVHDVLPAAYGDRRDNRGFEAVAVSPDESRLWALVQSPLDHPEPGPGRETGNVRLLAFDLASRRPAAEFIYEMDDPRTEAASSAPPADQAGAAAPPVPPDGKLCAVVALGPETLLVLEQEGGRARLYRCNVEGATDTLHRDPGLPAVETLADLRAGGVVPVRKTLVADLTPLLPTLRRDVLGGEPPADAPPIELKLEGLAVTGPRRIVLVNDNDFAVATATGPAPRTCMWVVELPTHFQGE